MQTPEQKIKKESSKISKLVIKKIFKDYKDKPHEEPSKEEAFDTIEDLIEMQEIISRMIVRRNNSYK